MQTRRNNGLKRRKCLILSLCLICFIIETPHVCNYLDRENIKNTFIKHMVPLFFNFYFFGIYSQNGNLSFGFHRLNLSTNIQAT